MKLTFRKCCQFVCATIVIGLLASCGSDNSTKRNLPDISDIDVNVELIRYDEILFDIDTLKVSEGLNELYASYPAFTELYFNQLTGFYNPDRDTFELTVTNFLQDKNMRNLQEKIENEFDDLSDIEKGLARGLGFLKYYFPKYKEPVFYTLNSEFGYQSFIFNEVQRPQPNARDGIGIGLDLFLGSDFNYKRVDPKNPSFSNYLVRTYNRDHIISKSMTVIAKDILGEAAGKRFIDQMIHNGKELYLLEHFLPESHDTIIMEHSLKQAEWLKNNELEIWSYFLEKNLMYETNFFEINKYLNPSPHSPGMPPEAPGKTANFIGLQIVKSFMRRNPEMNLQDLIAFVDNQKLLEMAKYKPKRR